MSMDELTPDSVHDRETFMRFVEALILDREEADELELQSPEEYRWVGANDWQNGTIASYLGCALAGAVARRDGWGSEAGVTWRELAILLWFGKSMSELRSNRSPKADAFGAACLRR